MNEIEYYNQKYLNDQRYPHQCQDYFLTQDFLKELTEKFKEYDNKFFNSQLSDFKLNLNYWDNFVWRFEIDENKEFYIWISKTNHKFTKQNKKYLRDMCKFMILIWCALNNLTSKEYHQKKIEINRMMKDVFKINIPHKGDYMIDLYIQQMKSLMK